MFPLAMCICLEPASKYILVSAILTSTVSSITDGGTSLFEGDIMLTEVQKEALPADESSTIETDLVRAKRSLNSVTPSPGKAIHQTWSNAIVPYVMSALLGKYFTGLVATIVVITIHNTLFT